MPGFSAEIYIRVDINNRTVAVAAVACALRTLQDSKIQVFWKIQLITSTFGTVLDEMEPIS
jgi:hypothetical protein